MAGQRKTTEDQLEALRRKQEAIKARLGALETRKKAEDSKRETRRAFVVGKVAVARAESDPAFRDALRNALQAAGLRDGDKAVIADLLGLGVTPPSPAAETAAKTEAA
jgi:hypothetical protein